MKFAACIVLYNPTIANIKNINSYPKFIEKIWVVDNSNGSNQILLSNVQDFDVCYIPLYENKGIAYALKTAASKAMAEGFDYLLTMDQDSLFPCNKEQELLEILSNKKNYTDYGIIGLNFNETLLQRKIIDCKYWITSGNFLNLKNYSKIKGFREELFIDWVDFDLGFQFKQVKKKIGYISDVSLIHSIGSPIKKRFLFKTFYCMNHSPIRYYYRYRNATYLWHEHKLFYLKNFLVERFVNYIKMIFFEPNKREKIIMVKKGIKDAKNKKLGKFCG